MPVLDAVSAYDLRPWLAAYGSQISVSPPEAGVDHLAGLVRQACQRFSGQIAFSTCMPNGMHGSITYAQLDQWSDDFACYLREDLQLEPGSRVAVQLPNCLAYPVVAFGILKAGCVLVNTNPLYTPHEMAHQFRDAGVKALVIVDLFANKLIELPSDLNIPHVITAEVTQFFSAVPRGVIRLVQRVWQQTLKTVTVPHTRLQKALAAGAKHRGNTALLQRYVANMTPDTLAALQYTGGTTGLSKGAMLSHRNLLVNVMQASVMGGKLISEGKETVLTALPLYHIFAFTFNLLAFLRAGAHNVLIPNPRPISNLQRAFDNYPITWVSGVNTLFNALLNEEWFVAFPPSHLKAGVAGGTALMTAVAERWRQVTQTPLAEGYGLTESSPVVCFNPITDRPRLGSIGIPVPGTDVRLVDEDGQAVAQGERGELIVRGPQVMQGYWEQAGETANALREGWLYTGDIATMSEDGFFRIVDRKKDMILVSGFNVYPNEVEDVISELEGVQEVAVVGMPDDKTGEAVRVFVVAGPSGVTEQEIRDHCRANLTDYKRPRQIVFREELPKTAVGKILRRALKDQ